VTLSVVIRTAEISNVAGKSPSVKRYVARLDLEERTPGGDAAESQAPAQITRARAHSFTGGRVGSRRELEGRPDHEALETNPSMVHRTRK
jgi:hypothetical protein